MVLERFAKPSLGEIRVLSSSLSHTANIANVAHRVEHQTENLGVTGSSPVVGTNLGPW